ncbi:hypothetical protein GF357_03530 [Candidatus Dojkabacteria bacterium]|nr:hypothetical protein [Candidatus Dojkabacteria bacterium]
MKRNFAGGKITDWLDSGVVAQILKYAFLLSIFVNIGSVIYEGNDYFKALRDLKYLPYIVVNFVLGLILIFIHKQKIQDRIDHLVMRSKVEESELSPERTFSKGFIRRMIEKERGIFVFLVLALLVLSSGIYFFRLGRFEFVNDEYIVVDTATGLYKTGTFYKWSWLENKSRAEIDCTGESKDIYCYYTKGSFHTALVAMSYRVFGVSEWSSRFPSAISGVIFIAIAYYVLRYFSNSKIVSIISIFILILHQHLIEIFRLTRMYSILAPLFLLIVYFSHRGLTGKSRWLRKMRNKIPKIFSRYFDFEYRYLFLAGMLISASIFLHPVGLIIGPVILIYTVYQAISTKEKRFISLLMLEIVFIVFFVVGTKVFPGLFTGLMERSLGGWVSLFARRNYDYLVDLFGYPFTTPVGLVFILGGFFLTRLISDKKLQSKIVYLFILVVVTATFFIFIGDNYSAFNYVSHVVSFAVLLEVFFAFILLGSVFDAGELKVLGVLLFAGLMYNFRGNLKYNYIQHKKYGSPSIACNSIRDYPSERKIVFARRLRDYYCQDLANDLEVIDILGYEDGVYMYSYEEFLNDLEKYKYDPRWVLWEEQKEYHVAYEIRHYLHESGKKIHGEGIDDTKMEVYYLAPERIEDVEE